MKKLLAALAIIAVAGTALPAQAGRCPVDMGKIDAALAAGSSLSSDQMAKVMELRQQGGAAHQSGAHKKSVKAMAEAMKLLGIY